MGEGAASALSQRTPPLDIVTVCAVRSKNGSQIFEEKHVFQHASFAYHLSLGFLGLDYFVMAHLPVCTCAPKFLCLRWSMSAPALMDFHPKFTPAWFVAMGAPGFGVPLIVIQTIYFEELGDIPRVHVVARFPRVMFVTVSLPFDQKRAVSHVSPCCQDFFHKEGVAPAAFTCMTLCSMRVVEDTSAANVWALEFADFFRFRRCGG